MPRTITGERVRALRRAKDWTIEDLIAMTELSESTIYRIETSADPRMARRLALGTIMDLALAFGVSIEYLIGWTNIPLPVPAQPRQPAPEPDPHTLFET
jgi:transcriptional regulator with XRE-family HTH domain